MNCNNNTNLLKINEEEFSKINFDIEMNKLKINRYKKELQNLQYKKSLLVPIIDSLKNKELKELQNTNCP